MPAAEGYPRAVPFGEAALLVELGQAVDFGLNRAVHALAARLADAQTQLARQGIAARESAPPVPGYASLLVPFDPEATDASALRERLLGMARAALREPVPEPADRPVLEIPVRYGGEDGPDLEAVAAATGLRPDGVVETHAATTYTVFMLGFAPGFAYLGTLPEELALPRRAEPRVRVPPGSVAVAGRQTAVYPFATPGGWHLLGRTDARLWDPDAQPPARLAPGDRVRFVPVAIR